MFEYLVPCITPDKFSVILSKSSLKISKLATWLILLSSDAFQKQGTALTFNLSSKKLLTFSIVNIL